MKYQILHVPSAEPIRKSENRSPDQFCSVEKAQEYMGNVGQPTGFAK